MVTFKQLRNSSGDPHTEGEGRKEGKSGEDCAHSGWQKGEEGGMRGEEGQVARVAGNEGRRTTTTGT